MRPRTQYARSGDVHIAYQVVGEGPDLMWVPGWVSHVEHWWDHPIPASFIRRLASFTRLTLFDKRGTGMSDRHAGIPTLDERLDDMSAVLEATGCEVSAILGITFEGSVIGSMWAATYPERTSALVLYGATARVLNAPDYPWGIPTEAFDTIVSTIEEAWNEEDFGITAMAPSHREDLALKEWFARWGRLSASPGAAAHLLRSLSRVDVRDVLPAIQAPTLVIHRTGDPTVSVDAGRYVASRIPGARFVELPGTDTAIFCGDVDPVLSEIRAFLRGTRSVPDPARILGTILFTDIVKSTDTAARLGDSMWRELVGKHDQVVRRGVQRHEGRVVESTGDGVLAVFDRPMRALQCALELGRDVRSLDLEIRAGVHTGVFERIGDRVGGLAVHIAARVVANAAANEVVVTSAVADLVEDSAVVLESRGTHVLKGVPGEWALFAARAA